MMPQDDANAIATLREAFAPVERLTILGRGPSAIDERARSLPQHAVLVSGPTYAMRDVFAGEPVGVLIGTPPDMVEAIARRFHETPLRNRPVLMYTFLSAVAPFDFGRFNLKPIPIAPILHASGFNDFDAPRYPTSGVFLTLLSAALDKGADVAGIDLYRHRSGRIYVNDKQEPGQFTWPEHHSLKCDVLHLRQAGARLRDRLNLSPELLRVVEET